MTKTFIKKKATKYNAYKNLTPEIQYALIKSEKIAIKNPIKSKLIKNNYSTIIKQGFDEKIKALFDSGMTPHNIAKNLYCSLEFVIQILDTPQSVKTTPFENGKRRLNTILIQEDEL